MRDLGAAFRRRHPRVSPRFEVSGSVEAARKVTDLGKVPDVVALADAAIIAELLMPAHARWYAVFASNAMVVAYTATSRGASDINLSNWMEVLQLPGVRIGRSDPAQDPSGYRALMVLQLAERFYGRPGLERALLANSPTRYTRPKEVDLIALLESGNLDYVLSYRTIARQGRFKWVDLPPEIDLSDAAREGAYRVARVTIPRSSRPGSGTIQLAGQPITYGVTVLSQAPNPVAARAFLRFLLGPEGRAVLAGRGFVLPERPGLAGDTARAAGYLP
jgi:molybdate/tungstate transport system substrate-binding protein